MRREVLEEDVPHVSLLFSVKAFDIFSQREREREIWRVVVVFVGRTFWRSLRTCLIVSLRLGWTCLWCPM